MKADKMRELDDREISHQLREVEDRLFRLRFQMATGQADGLKKFRELKKDRARLLTVQRQRELAS